MQSLTQQGWGGPESLHLTSSQVMLTILDCGAHFLYSKADGDKSTERPPPSPSIGPCRVLVWGLPARHRDPGIFKIGDDFCGDIETQMGAPGLPTVLKYLRRLRL